MTDLTISKLSKSFGTFQALKDITLDIASGEFICLLGGSGCGKTTLLRLIAGLETHDGGQILAGGSDLSVIPCHQRNIGMVFQSLALFPHLDVAGNIGYGLALRGTDKGTSTSEIDRLLGMVGLAGLGARRVSALSGGQRQRVAIARALAMQPDFFLMDEPFSALDAALRDQMQIEVKRIQRDLGVTTIFVTHDQREAMSLADRVVIMNEGCIEQAGTPDDLYARPQTRFVAEFIGDNNVLDIEVENGGAQVLGAAVKANIGDLAMQSGPRAIAIRPEVIRLAPADTGDLRGHVIAQRRLGALVERQIEVRGHVILQTAFAGDGSSFANGDEVSLSWDWNNVWMVPQ